MARLGGLLQEKADSPFQVLVACVLLNRTTREQVDRIWPEVVERWGEPGPMSRANAAELGEVLRPLGFWRTRAATLKVMALAYIADRPTTAAEVLELPGCGRYAADAWAIFVEGREDVHPFDGILAVRAEQIRREIRRGGTPLARPLAVQL